MSLFPAVLWVAFAGSVYFTLRGTIMQRLVPRLTAVRALGVEVELAGELLLQGGKTLWVDDRPEGNAPLVELFRTAGMHIDIALSTEEATPLFRRRPYDSIISDIDRSGDRQAGIKMLRLLAQYNLDVPVLIYTGRFNPERGVDRRIFAATTAPVDLVHYVIDLMERARLGSL